MDDDRPTTPPSDGAGGAGSPAEPSYPGWVYPSEPAYVPPAPEEPAGSPVPAEEPAPSPVPAAEEFASSAPEVPRRGVLRYAVVAVAGAFLVAAAFLGMKLFSLRGSGDVLTRMAPADSDAYVTVYLDPSLGQKVALRALVNKFPAADGVKGLQDKVDQALDRLLAPTGVRYSTDVKPWVGAQVSLVVRLDGRTPHMAVLVASKDDGAAQRALATSEAADRRKGPTRFESHGGVRIFVCTCPDSADVVVFTGHTAVLGDDVGLVEDIIDTAQGGPALSSTSDYAEAVAGLPKDRLVLAYANAGSLIHRFGSDLGAAAGLEGGSLFSSSTSALGAYRGVGMALYVQPDGVGLDVSLSTDPTELTAGQRASLAAGDHLNTTLEWTPQQAYGVFAIANVDDAAKGFVDQVSKADPDAAAMLDGDGLSGPDGVLSHLTGDLAVEASPGLGPFPDVAVLAGTDDRVAVRRSLDRLADAATREITAALGQGQSGLPPPEWHRFDYPTPGGAAVSISWLGAPELATMGIEPAYASVDGMTIVGSSRHAIQAALDAHGGKGNVTQGPDFRSALAHGNVNSSTLEYVDIAAVVEAIRGALPVEARRAFEVDTLPNLTPLRTFMATATTGPDRSTARLFLSIR